MVCIWVARAGFEQRGEEIVIVGAFGEWAAEWEGKMFLSSVRRWTGVTMVGAEREGGRTPPYLERSIGPQTSPEPCPSSPDPVTKALGCKRFQIRLAIIRREEKGKQIRDRVGDRDKERKTKAFCV